MDAVVEKPPRSRRLATVAVLLALVVAAFESTVVTTAMPSITAALGGRDIYAWVFSAFLLASMVGILACGKLADAFGRRPVFVAGMGVFLAGSMLCGLATTTGQLIGFRVVQGLGAGAIQPIAMTISADLYSLRERARIQAIFTTAWGSANALGPLIGGWIVDHTSWRWVFLVNVPVGAITVVMLMVSYRDPPRESGGPTGLLGALLAGGAAAVSLLAIEPAKGMTEHQRVVAACVALSAFAILAREQGRTEVPILPRALLGDAVVRAGVVGSVFTGAILHVSAAYVPLWLATARGQTPLAAGAALMPLLVAWAVASSFGVRVLVRWGMRVSVGGGFVLVVAGTAALAATVRMSLPIPLCFAALALLGFGLGPAASTSLVASQSHVEWRHRGMVTSTIYASRMLGGALAIAMLGAMADGDPAALFTAVAALAAVALVTILALAPGHVTEAGLS